MEGELKVDVAQVYHPFTADSDQPAMITTRTWQEGGTHPSLTVAVVMRKEWIQATKRSGRRPID